MEKYILLIILIAFVIYIYCNRKKGLVEGLNTEEERLAERALSGGVVATVVDEAAAKAALHAEGMAAAEVANMAKMGENMNKDTIETMLGDSTDMSSGLLEGTEFEGKTADGILEHINAHPELKDKFAELMSKGKAIKDAARGNTDLERLLVDGIKGKEGAELSKAILDGKKIGDILKSADVVGATTAEQLAENVASRVSGKSAEKIKGILGKFRKKHPSLTNWAAGILGAYGLLLIFEESDAECEDNCKTGTPQTWVDAHSNYSEFCNDKTSSECSEYCNPIAGGSEDEANLKGDDAPCSPRSRMKRIITQVEEDVGGGMEDALSATWDAFTGFLSSGLGLLIMTLCGIFCTGIVGWVIFSMMHSKVVSGVKNLDDTIGKGFGGEIYKGSKTLSKGFLGGGLSQNHTKHYIIIIFFIFIIYNEWFRRK